MADLGSAGTSGSTRAVSACPLDCPDACSLDVRIEDGRVVSIGGSDTNPITQSYICAKVRRYPEHLYGPDRIRFPQVRTGRKGEGHFRRVSWDDALERIASRMKALAASGRAERILPFSYGGSNGYLSQDTTDARLFGRLGASRLARTVCAAPSGAAALGLYGKMAGVALQDYVHAKLIILWGVNPSVSGIHLVPYVLEAQKRGGKLVVVDPRRTRLAEHADLHLAIHPGTDLPVALSIIRWLFENRAVDRQFLARHADGVEELARRAEPWTSEKAGEVARVSRVDIERLAGLYADSSPAAIRCGWGLERNRNGGSAVAAVLALPAIAGKFGIRGGGYTMSNSKAFDLDSLSSARIDAPGASPPAKLPREINMNRLGEALLGRAGEPVELLFVYNANPAATIPSQGKVLSGLVRQDLFTVVFDPIFTDTARYADVLLPASTFLEREELVRGYGAFALQESKPVVAPVAESRPNHEVFAELCRRTGVARHGDPETADELTREILGANPSGAQIREAIDRGGIAFPAGNPAPVQFVDVFPKTSDGKIHLVPEELDREAPQGLYRFQPETPDAAFPLALISPASDRTISSTLGELRREAVSLELSPQDAKERGISDGARVRVWNHHGEVLCRARWNVKLRPGVALLPKGLWSHNTDSGTAATALAPDTLTDIGGGACFNDARVQVELRRSQ